MSEEQVVGALERFYNLSQEERDAMGEKGMAHVQTNYNFEDFTTRWIELADDIVERLGSWDTRKGYKAWELKEAM